jgi:dihydroxyacetone kinase-like protein
MRAWIERFAAVFASSRDLLDDLDRQSGDGDFGTNLESAMERVAQGLEDAPPETPGAVLGVVATAFMHTGGTSGPLFGMWFTQLSRAAGAEAAIGLAELAAGAGAGLAGIQRLGGAQPGDKTMVDAMAPAAAALADAAAGGAAVADGLAQTAAAARAGADATAPMLARRGRASYVGEAARGVCDPGALTVAMLFESALGG